MWVCIYLIHSHMCTSIHLSFLPDPFSCLQEISIDSCLCCGACLKQSGEATVTAVLAKLFGCSPKLPKKKRAICRKAHLTRSRKWWNFGFSRFDSGVESRTPSSSTAMTDMLEARLAVKRQVHQPKNELRLPRTMVCMTSSSSSSTSKEFRAAADIASVAGVRWEELPQKEASPVRPGPNEGFKQSND